MTGAELREIRELLALSPANWGRALGMRGNHNTIRKEIMRLEMGPYVHRTTELLARMYEHCREVPDAIWEQIGWDPYLECTIRKEDA